MPTTHRPDPTLGPRQAKILGVRIYDDSRVQDGVPSSPLPETKCDPTRLKKTFLGLSFIKSEHPVYTRNGVDKLRRNIVFSSVFIVYLFIYTEVRLY